MNVVTPVMEWPLQAVRRSVGRLRGLLRTFFKSLSIQSIDERTDAFQFSMAVPEREANAQIGEGLTWASCVAVISGNLVQSLL